MESSNVNNKRIAKNTAYLTIRALLIMFISLYTSRVILDKLGVEDFGIYNVVGGFVGIFSFLKTSFSSVTQRFLNLSLGRDDQVEARKIFSQHLLLYCIAIVILIILAETVGLYFVENKLVIPKNRLDIAITIYHFSVLTICINIFGIVYNSAIIAHENMKVFSYIGIIEGLSKLGIAFSLVVCDIDRLLLYGFLMMLLQLLIQLYSYIYCRIKYTECRFMRYWSKGDILQSIRMIGWDFVNNITFVFKDQFLTILLNIFFGPVVNAARAVTAQVNMAINSFCGGFMTSVKPQLVKSYAKDDKSYLISLFFKSSKYSFFIIYAFCLPVILCVHTLLSLWLKEVPRYTEVFVIWNLMESICAVLLAPNWTMTLASGKLRKYVLMCNLANLMVFPFCYICFLCGGSPIWAYVIAFLMRVLEVCFALYNSNLVIGYGIRQYLNKVIRPCLIVVCITVIVSYPINRMLGEGFISLVLTTIVSLLSLVVAVWFLGATQGEKQYIREFVKNKFLKNTKH